ncbi:MAG: GntR family transcriptional regulator, partial [Verrucomicrobia bacterium]|nr:GntR family transcriptional regulator [Verrucomicrobiota bacterium]
MCTDRRRRFRWSRVQAVPQRHSLVGQTVACLQSAIAAGQWREWLPAERALCELLQVSRSTLRRALAQLQRDGAIRAEHRTARRQRPAQPRRDGCARPARLARAAASLGDLARRGSVPLVRGARACALRGEPARLRPQPPPTRARTARGRRGEPARRAAHAPVRARREHRPRAGLRRTIAVEWWVAHSVRGPPRSPRNPNDESDPMGYLRRSPPHGSRAEVATRYHAAGVAAGVPAPFPRFHPPHENHAHPPSPRPARLRLPHATVPFRRRPRVQRRRHRCPRHPAHGLAPRIVRAVGGLPRPVARQASRRRLRREDPRQDRHGRHRRQRLHRRRRHLGPPRHDL